MDGVRKCFMCTKSPRFRKLAHILDVKVKVHQNEDEMISYFDAMQQLTGWSNKLEFETGTSHRICIDCQNKIRYAFQIRNEIINAFDTKNTKSVEVYQIINVRSNKQGHHHEELVEITEVDDDFKLEQITPDLNNKIETVYVEEAREDIKGTMEEIEIFEVEEIAEEEEEEEDDDDNDDDDNDEGPMDAVSFLLEKRELFKEDSNNKSTKANGQRRTHKCDVEGCEKVFMRKSNLVDHLRLHAQIRNYKCEYCKKEFVQAGNYRSHLRIHTKERPYQCSMCDKTYNQSSALKVHIRSHTNEKNYICPMKECSKAFTNSSDLNKHKRVHDPSLKIKCDHCEKTFAQRVNLKNHIMRHHNKK